MTEIEWNACRDPEAMLPLIPPGSSQKRLRLFAAACVRRVWHLLPEASRAAVDASERYAVEEIGADDLELAVEGASKAAEEVYPGHSAPDSKAFATSAAVDAAAAWPKDSANILAASTCAASAKACQAAETVGDLEYDAVQDRVYREELAAQADILRGLVPFPGLPPR